jgi:hypothetical protein
VVSAALPCGFGSRGAVNSSSVLDFATVPPCCVGKATAAQSVVRTLPLLSLEIIQRFSLYACAFGLLVARIGWYGPCRRHILALRRRSQPVGRKKGSGTVGSPLDGSDTHMINLWNLNLICHFIALGLFYYHFYLLLLRFGIYLHLVTTNKILANL